MNRHSFRFKTLLEELDWDCQDQSHRIDSLNMIHGYPGSFISSIPGNIIDIFSNEKDIVWDPFCGSGISAIESIKRNRAFYGNDINEIAIITTLAKIKLIENFSLFKNHSPKLLNFIEVKEAESKLGIHNSYQIDTKLYPMEDLTPWYASKHIKQLAQLDALITEFPTPESLKVIYKAIFLNLARLASAQQKTWGHIADNVKPKKEQIIKREIDIINTFRKRIFQLRKKGEKLYLPQSKPIYSIETANAIEFCPRTKVDLVITSPPYPQMNDYVTSHRLSYYWLNFSINEINKIKKGELGARYRRHSPFKNANYKADLLKAFDNIITHTKKNGIIAIVLPNYSKTDERRKIINEFYTCLEKRIEKLHAIERTIDSNRWGPFKTLKTELLTVWCKNA